MEQRLACNTLIYVHDFQSVTSVPWITNLFLWITLCLIKLETHTSYFQHLSGMHEAVFSNLEACTELYKTIKSCYGPKGLNKMVINHLSKLFVTNDAATIIKVSKIYFMFCTKLLNKTFTSFSSFVILSSSEKTCTLFTFLEMSGGTSSTNNEFHWL